MWFTIRACAAASLLAWSAIVRLPVSKAEYVMEFCRVVDVW
jgi:hypothetical protein